MRERERESRVYVMVFPRSAQGKRKKTGEEGEEGEEGEGSGKTSETERDVDRRGGEGGEREGVRGGGEGVRGGGEVRHSLSVLDSQVSPHLSCPPSCFFLDLHTLPLFFFCIAQYLLIIPTLPRSPFPTLREPHTGMLQK